MELANTVYALDSSTIESVVVSVGSFPLHQAAVKLHTLLDLRGAIPSFIHVSDGRLHDVNVLDLLLPETGAFYLMDRAYLDFVRLYRLDQAGRFFVTRAKRNRNARRLYSAPVDRSTGLICDQTIALNNFFKSHLPDLLSQLCRSHRAPPARKGHENRTDRVLQLRTISQYAIDLVLVSG